MNQGKVTLGHISDLVSRLVDGWSIMNHATTDIHTMSSLAAIFATSLGPHAAGYTLQEVMAAFMEGVEHGTHCLAHWSSSRSGTRRSRFRKA